MNREEKIRRRAYHLWLDEGQPPGREMEHWDLASELVAIEENSDTMLKPNPLKPGEEIMPDPPAEEASLMENLGEFPTLTDQGAEETTPEARPAPKPRRVAKPKAPAAEATPAPAEKPAPRPRAPRAKPAKS